MKNKITKLQQLILDNVSYGKENAITKRELMKKCGIINERHVRNLIEDLRSNHGILICSSSKRSGYYYPREKEEAIEFQKEMIARVINIRKTIKSVNNWIKQNENQLQIEV